MKLENCPHCGVILTKPRSPRHHRRLFALINAATFQWRHDHEFQPESPEHLRAWLLCRAGYRQTREVPVAYSEGNPALAKLTALAIEAALKEAGAFAFINPCPSGSSVLIYRPKSLAWHQMDQKAFAPLAEAVEQIIEQELGVKASDLLKETERAA